MPTAHALGRRSATKATAAPCMAPMVHIQQDRDMFAGYFFTVTDCIDITRLV